jgi:hypothetical protein
MATNLYDDARALLRELAGPHGIHASASAEANYRAVFTRDAVMAGVAGLIIGDDEVSSALVRTLTWLRDLQGTEGQVPSNYGVRPDGSTHVSFGTMAPRIDATTWYLIGIALAARANVLDPEPFRASARAVVRLLDALEYNGRHLVYIPAGGNWADEYIYDGYILYDQVLRAWALRLLGATYGEHAWRDKARHIEETIEERYWPAADANRTHPIAAFSPTITRDIFDLAACSMLAVSGIGQRVGAATLDGIANRFLRRSQLPPAFRPVIEETDADWPALRRYHLHDFRNRPHEYHNGGIWPIWLGWLALGLARAKRADDLARLRRLIEGHLAALPDYAFEEYLHGRTGKPGGIPRMAYSATGLTFLRVAGTEAHLRLLAL